jgi:hypothetical protein
MTYSGFATPLNQSVLGMDRFVSNVDNKPYQLLTYSSGLGYNNYNESIAKTEAKNSHHKATIASTWANHAANDVPLFAIGPLSNHLFSGTYDQTYLSHAVAYAMCLFKYKSRCHHTNSTIIPKKLSGIEALRQELLKQNNQKIPAIAINASAQGANSELNINAYESLDLISDDLSSNDTSMPSTASLTAIIEINSLIVLFVMFIR